ncbi:MAG TPA: FGGY-family carbohydrate kinase, partial [Bacillota bacterium]|nr:FGGY-family carbohydrate kinase [Bacillota bacterium]
QQASLFGQLCCEKGMVNSTYGTGCFVLMNTGSEVVSSKNGMLSTIAWKYNGNLMYALEGSVFVGGSVIQWLRDGLKIIKSAAATEELATRIDSNDGVYLVPAFVGLGTPHWDMEAKGAIFGLTRGTDERQIARAALESICFQVHDVLKAMEKDCSEKIPFLKANGGATVNNYLMQFQSDILDVEVKRAIIQETTALGAAYLAGLAEGYWTSPEEIHEQRFEDFTFSPRMEEALRSKLIKEWNVAVDTTKHFKI